MCLETNMELERKQILPGDIDCRHLEVRLHGSPGHIAADLFVNSSGRVVVSSATDTFGIGPIGREVLVLAVHKNLGRYLGATETSTIVWVRWVEPNVIGWLSENLPEPMASKIITTLAAHSDLTEPRFEKGFTESLME